MYTTKLVWRDKKKKKQYFLVINHIKIDLKSNVSDPKQWNTSKTKIVKKCFFIFGSFSGSSLDFDGHESSFFL